MFCRACPKFCPLQSPDSSKSWQASKNEWNTVGKVEADDAVVFFSCPTADPGQLKKWQFHSILPQTQHSHNFDRGRHRLQFLSYILSNEAFFLLAIKYRFKDYVWSDSFDLVLSSWLKLWERKWPSWRATPSWSAALKWWTAPWSRMIWSSMCLSSPSNLVFSRECQLPPTVSRTHHCSSGCLPGYALPKIRNTKKHKIRNTLEEVEGNTKIKVWNIQKE